MNQQEIIETFGLFSDWMEKYQYIIDLGKKNPPLDEKQKIDENLLEGCQSRVWLIYDMKDGLIHFQANSDATIVSGLIALVLSVYSEKTPEYIVKTEPDFIKVIGLSSHLSSTRSNGLYAMIDKIKKIAKTQLAKKTN